MQQSYSLSNLANLKAEAFKNGLVWVFIDIVLFLLVYYVKPEIMGSIGYTIVSMLIRIGLAVYFTLDLRKKIGGFWKFRDALSGVFIMLLVSGLVFYVFSVAFAKLEPSYVTTMTEISEKSTVGMMEKMGQSQESIDEALKGVHKSLDSQFNPGIGDAAKTVAIMVLMYFIGSLIMAAIFKKELPAYSVPPEE